MGYSAAQKKRIMEQFIFNDYATGADYVYDGLKKISQRGGGRGKRRRRQKRNFKRQKGGFIDDIANFFEKLR